MADEESVANCTQMAGALVDQLTGPESLWEKHIPQITGLLCGELLVLAFLKPEEYFRIPDPLFTCCWDILLGAKILNTNAR